MSVTVSPRPPETDQEQADPSQLDQELELLIEEARARARRRRLVYAATALVALAAVAAYLGGGVGGGGLFNRGAADGGHSRDAGIRSDARLASAAGAVPWRPVAFYLAMNPRNPAILYAVTSQGIFKSTDGARSWRRASLGAYYGPPIGSGGIGLAISPTNPSTVYAATDQGSFKTTNGGRNWHPTGLRAREVGGLVVDPANARTVYAGTTHGLLKSTDGGRSWHRVGASLPAEYVGEFAIDPTDSRTIYVVVGEAADRLFVSRDGGRHWRPRTIRARTYIPSIAFDPHEPGAVYAGTQTGIYESTTHGASWREINTDFMIGDRRAQAPLAFSPAKRGTQPAAAWHRGAAHRTALPSTRTTRTRSTRWCPITASTRASTAPATGSSPHSRPQTDLHRKSSRSIAKGTGCS